MMYLSYILSIYSPILLYSGSADVWKNFAVEPPFTTPYLITSCASRSCALLIGFSNVSTVKKAAKLAVYDAMTIMANKNQTLAKILLNMECFTMYFIFIKCVIFLLTLKFKGNNNLNTFRNRRQELHLTLAA